MQITITHARYAPSWELMEKMIREATNEPSGQLVKIARVDRSSDYRALGKYTLGFRQSNNTILPINLDIS